MPTDTVQRTKFRHADGAGAFNDEDNLFYAQQYGQIDQEAAAALKSSRLAQLFGPGEIRAIEHGEDYYVWRFEHKTAALRVVAPRENVDALSSIQVEKDVPIATIDEVEPHRQAVIEFVRLLLEAVEE